MIYEHILKGNKEFGTNPFNIVKSSLGCEQEMIKKNVILAPVWKPELFEDYTDNIVEIYDGLHKIWNLEIGNKVITYIVTGIGAPNVLEAILALGCTPCEKIVFIGSVGGLDRNLKIGDLVIPKYSICGDGSCRYLTNKKLIENDCFGEKYYPNNEFFNDIVSKTEELTKPDNVKWHIGRNFSIDTIIAQFAHIEEIISMDCNCIEMETAALFKASEICNIKTVAIFSVSDNTILKKSLMSGRTKEELEYRKYNRKNILTKIVIKCLE